MSCPRSRTASPNVPMALVDVSCVLQQSVIMPSTSSPSLITPRQATAEVVYWPGRACDRGLRSWEGSALKPKIAIFFVIEPIRTLKQSFLLCCHPCHSFQRQRPRSRTAPPSRTLFRRRSRVVLFLQSGQSSRPMSSSCQRFVRPSPISHHPLKSTTLPSIAIPRVVVTTFRWTIRRDAVEM